MASAPFKFKQFSIQQDQCAMKVGTDGVLLGAWASTNQNPESVLDIGAGTGLLSLMIAQRTTYPFIEAIEIDADAYEQCANNFEASPWADRLFCYHASLLEFVDEVEDQFDLIICNPPFYDASFKSDESSRNLARFQDAMPFDHLIYAVLHLLSNNGLFALVIPFEFHEGFIEMVQSASLFLSRKCLVKGTPTSEPKRVLLEFSRQKTELTEQSLIIETKRHIYTEDYINLTRDFYLKM